MSMLRTNANAQLAGLRVHVYHYSWFTTVAGAKLKQAIS